MTKLTISQFFVFLLFFSFSVYSQEKSLRFRNYTALDGLPSSEVYDITQDDQGYLWFATDRGLTRFDGRSFQTYTVTEGLTDNVVFGFYEQKNGEIWCSTLSNQIFFFRNGTDGFVQYPFNDSIEKYARSLNPNSLEIINGSLYMSFHKHFGYLKIDSKGNVQSLLRLIDSTNRFLVSPEDAEYFCYQDSENRPNSIQVHFSRPIRSSISRKMKLHQGKEVFVYGPYCSIRSGGVHKMCELENSYSMIMAGKFDADHFWMGYAIGGVRIVSSKGKVVNHFLKDKSVTCAYIDHEGGLWLSTLNNGIFYCTQTAIDHYEIPGAMTDLSEDRNGNLYCSSTAGKLYKYTNGKWEVFLEASGNLLNSIVQGEEPDLFFHGYRDQVMQQYNGETTFLTSRHLRSFSDNRTGPSLGVLEHSTVVKFSKDSIEEIVQSPSITYDAEAYLGGYLLATREGLYQYSEGKLSFLGEQFEELKGRIQDVDVIGRIAVLATMSKGVIILDGEKITQISREDGLISNTCTEVFIESETVFWVGTNQGVCKVVAGEDGFVIESLSYEKGIPFSEVLDLHKQGDYLWIGTKEGLFGVDESRFKKLNASRKKWLHFTGILVNGKPVGQRTEFNYQQNKWEFTFDAVAFKSRGGHYRTQLKGNNSDWIYSNEGQRSYTNLAPGNYEFIVQVLSEDGSWKEEIRHVFTIAPPFWKTTWFILTVIGFIVLLIYASFRYKLLSFNKHLAKEFLRLILKRLRSDKRLYVMVKSSRNQIKLATEEILYFNSSGNYFEIHTASDRHVCRGKISEFYDTLPDKVEFVRLHRSYYVRIEHISQIGSKTIFVGKDEIPVSKTYRENLKRVQIDHITRTKKP